MSGSQSLELGAVLLVQLALVLYVTTRQADAVRRAGPGSGFQDLPVVYGRGTTDWLVLE